MRVEILGSAAGGGFPQWNCGCKNCHSLRAGTFSGKARTQTQVAVSEDGKIWFLLNASPDLRLQIEKCPALFPADNVRGSPIAGVIVSSADIDQIAGLFSLRELHRFTIYSSSSIIRILREDNTALGMLNRIPDQVRWEAIQPGKGFPLLAADGIDSGIDCEAVALKKGFPQYVSPDRAAELNTNEASLGLVLTSKSGKRLAYFPAVADLSDDLLQVFESADVLLFDGTFWCNDELIRVQGDGATAREMGHIPVSGEHGSLEKLKSLRHPRKIFIHLNNTNPMLDEASAEHTAVKSAGWEVAEDGWHLEL